MPCLVCDGEFSVSALLTGYEIGDGDLALELTRIDTAVRTISNDLQHGFARMETAVTSVEGITRRVMRALSVEVKDCPRIFTLVSRSSGRLKDVAVHTLELTLWCEHPSEWHPWPPASYTIRQPRSWIHTVAPYLNAVLKTLQVAVPVTVALAGVVLPANVIAAAREELKLMSALAEQLPKDVLNPSSDLSHSGHGLTTAQGAALRAIRVLLFEHDVARAFGDLRRVVSPSGDFLWVCPTHYAQYNPEPPSVPYTLEQADEASY